MTLQESIENKLANHDWHYEFAEGLDSYNRGLKEKHELWGLLKLFSKETQRDLLDKYCPHDPAGIREDWERGLK
jgi:hypothetical protein